MRVDELRLLQWIRMLSFEVLSHNNDNSQSICLFIQIMNMQPDLQSLLNHNPHLQEMMQSPNFLCQISSPESLQV
jgi:hypothetical protein